MIDNPMYWSDPPEPEPCPGDDPEPLANPAEIEPDPDDEPGDDPEPWRYRDALIRSCQKYAGIEYDRRSRGDE